MKKLPYINTALIVFVLIVSLAGLIRSSNNFGATPTSNFTRVDISEDLTVGTTLGVTGAVTLSSTLGVTGVTTLTGELLVEDFSQGGGALATTGYGDVSYSAADLCDYGIIRHNPISDGESSAGASVSFPSEADLVADCLASSGDRRYLLIENTATQSWAVDGGEPNDIQFSVDTGDRAINYMIATNTTASTSMGYQDFAILMIANMGGSISYSIWIDE